MTPVSKVPLSSISRIIGGGKSGLSGNDFIDVGYPAYGAGGLNGYLPDFEHDGEAIVLSSIGARCGKCFYPDGKWASLANTQLIFPDPVRVDRRFLWYQLNDESRWHRSGTAQPYIKPSDVKSNLVTLPPLPEQRRIASILDQAEALRAKRRDALAHMDDLADATFDNMFGDLVAGGKSSRSSCLLGELAEVVSGITKGRKAKDPMRVVPYLTVANVQDKSIRLHTVKEIAATESEIARYSLRPGDLLLTEGGDPDKLGRGALWAGEIFECIHQNHVFRVRVIDPDAIDPFYLSWLVGSTYGKSFFLKAAKQTTGIASINATQLRSFPVLLPPMAIQISFREQLSRLKMHRGKLVENLAHLDELFASLQHRAFRGEL